MSNIDWSGQTPTPPQTPTPAESIWSGNVPAPSAPQYAPYAPAATQGSKTWIGVVLGVGAMAFLIVGLIVVRAILSASADSFAPTEPEPTAPTITESEPVERGTILPATEYAMAERPGWQEMVDTVSGINTKYKDALADGTIVNMTPVSMKDNPDYLGAGEPRGL